VPCECECECECEGLQLKARCALTLTLTLALTLTLTLALALTLTLALSASLSLSLSPSPSHSPSSCPSLPPSPPLSYAHCPRPPNLPYPTHTNCPHTRAHARTHLAHEQTAGRSPWAVSCHARASVSQASRVPYHWKGRSPWAVSCHHGTRARRRRDTRACTRRRRDTGHLRLYTCAPCSYTRCDRDTCTHAHTAGRSPWLELGARLGLPVPDIPAFSDVSRPAPRSAHSLLPPSPPSSLLAGHRVRTRH
jgi:hypothetical protein